MAKPEYQHFLTEARVLCLRALPAFFVNFRDICLPYVADMTSLLLKFSHEQALINCDLHTWFEILKALRTLLCLYGIGAVETVRQVAF